MSKGKDPLDIDLRELSKQKFPGFGYDQYTATAVACLVVAQEIKMLREVLEEIQEKGITIYKEIAD